MVSPAARLATRWRGLPLTAAGLGWLVPRLRLRQVLRAGLRSVRGKVLRCRSVTAWWLVLLVPWVLLVPRVVVLVLVVVPSLGGLPVSVLCRHHEIW